jgi:hypothetical protein
MGRRRPDLGEVVRDWRDAHTDHGGGQQPQAGAGGEDLTSQPTAPSSASPAIVRNPPWCSAFAMLTVLCTI